MKDDPTAAKYTKKQMGDACEMLVAVELTLAGVPALKVPDLWPGYDVIAQPPSQNPQRISVKSRTFKDGAAFITYQSDDEFDWLAIVILEPGKRCIYIIPRKLCDDTARRNAPSTKTANNRYWRINEIHKRFSAYKDNFSLQTDPRST